MDKLEIQEQTRPSGSLCKWLDLQSKKTAERAEESVILRNMASEEFHVGHKTYSPGRITTYTPTL